MWATLLVMAIAVSVEPFRIGMTLMMLNRPRPASQLLAFLCGGFTMGVGFGLVVLFIIRETLTDATHLTLPKVQIVIGVLALLAAAALATNISVRRPQHARVAATVGGDGAVVEEPLPTISRRLAARARDLMQGSSLWVAWVAGMGIALPSIDYVAALAVILSSKTAPVTQAGALLAFNVVAFALVEIPLLSYLAAPDKTRASLAALNDWIRSRRRRDVAALLAVAGCAMLAVGVIGSGS